MPELPEVETTKVSLNPLLDSTVSSVDVHCSKLRWKIPDDLDSIIGYELKKVERRAKYLILTFIPPHSCDQAKNSTNATPINIEKKVIIHLGMSGSLQQHSQQSQKRKHDHVIMQFNNSQQQTIQLHYHDPRRFGAILWYEEYAEKLLSHLGVEPLTDSFNADSLYNQIHPNLINEKTKKRAVTRPIKAVIMDQKFVVGVGNIYATESLFLSHIHPLTPANELSKAQLEVLISHIKQVLNKSIKQGGSSLKDFSVAKEQTGYFQQTLHIYGKHNQPCPNCDTTIEKVNITGRSSTFCPRCQPYDKKV